MLSARFQNGDFIYVSKSGSHLCVSGNWAWRAGNFLFIHKLENHPAEAKVEMVSNPEKRGKHNLYTIIQFSFQFFGKLNCQKNVETTTP